MRFYYVEVPTNNDDSDAGGIWETTKARAIQVAKELVRDLPDSGYEFIGNTVRVVRVDVTTSKDGLKTLLQRIENRRTPEGEEVWSGTFAESDT